MVQIWEAELGELPPGAVWKRLCLQDVAAAKRRAKLADEEKQRTEVSTHDNPNLFLANVEVQRREEKGKKDGANLQRS